MTLQTRLANLSTRISTQVKLLNTLLNGNAADNSALVTTAKANLVEAINEVKGIADAAAGGGVSINDLATNTTQAWSSQQVSDFVTNLTNGILDGAPAALDTLNEIAAALQDDENSVANILTEQALRVAVTAQTFTAPQQAQARTNIGAQASADIGDPDVDLVAIFDAGLV